MRVHVLEVGVYVIGVPVQGVVLHLEVVPGEEVTSFCTNSTRSCSVFCSRIWSPGEVARGVAQVVILVPEHSL